MKLLLDECLPRKLKGALPGHEVKTVPEMGWAGIENGELLPLIESKFDAFITIDGNMRYQQNMSGRSFALIVLKAGDNTIETLLPLMPQVLAALPSLVPEQIVRIAALPAL
jgi:predicted nuclease of predicted toxin-antitoxin system